VAKPEIRHAGIVDVEFGKDVTVVQPVNLYGCTIRDGSFVGPFVEIQKGVNRQAMPDSIALIYL
jgi:carbonic anhydrase/acetyltransferase-like protein (isoleucine patch superfamily)